MQYLSRCWTQARTARTAGALACTGLAALLALPHSAVAQSPAPNPAPSPAQSTAPVASPAGQHSQGGNPNTGGNPGADSTVEPGVNLGVARALDAMIERAHGLIGTPYRNGGHSPDTGFDCSGFAGYLYRDILGFQLPRSAQQIWKFGKTVEREDLRPGDLVFYNTLKRPYSHVGIYLGDNRFIHSPASGGRVNIVDMNQRYWAARWNGAKRVVQ
jgi:cell wall-associated NlpC family hydrolase